MEYLINNIYVSIGNRVDRQCVGIPMGTDCAPLLANLFLFYYEYKYMKNLIKNNIILAKKFNNTMRYIGDLLTLNNTQFDAAIQDIYPQELQLKKTTESVTALAVINPRRACAARVTTRVTIVVLCVCVSVCLCVRDYSRTTGYEAAYERYQHLQCHKGTKPKQAILLKRLRSRDMA